MEDVRLGPRRETQEEAEARMAQFVTRVTEAVMAQKVRAKFRLNSYTTEMHTKPGRKPDGSQDWQNSTPVEKRTLNFTPVYANGDPNHENSRFWDATPGGSIQLGVVNPEAWEHFELGKEYYLDFTPAE